MSRFTLSAAALLCICVLQSASATDFHVYYLGGQSNMDGYGYVDQLPAELNTPVDGVWIFHGNTAQDAKPVDGRGVWSPLRPGHGVGFKSDGQTVQYSNRFGVELTLGRRLKEIYPDRNIAFVKYSRGGTSISIEAARNFGCWDPDFTGGEGEPKGVNQYDHFLATVRNATAAHDIDGDGTGDRLIPAGIVWMQGESDAGSQEIADRYEANLKRLMDLIRAAWRVDDLRVVVGRISDSGNDKSDGKVWDFGETVREAQRAFCEKDVNAALVTSTDKYDYSDPWHYDTAGYLDLGIEFANALAGQLPKAAVE